MTAPSHARQARPIVPELAALGEAARRAIDAEWLTDDERADLRIFHGVWDERDLRSPTDHALAALSAWDFEHPALADPTVPIEVRAEAMLKRGDLREVIALLEGVDSMRGGRIRTEAFEQLGEFDAANEAVNEPVRRLLREHIGDAADLTEGVRALFVRARLQGQPARDFQSMMTLLARAHQELDRLYWPAKLAEAELLFEKDDARAAVETLHEVLALNPRSSEAWHMLGRIAASRFNFAAADSATETLRRFNRRHPLADLLAAETRLILDDPEGALELLDPLIERLPMLRQAHALHAAAQAILYDEEATRQSLARYESLSPGGALAYYVAGRQLSFNRQYEAAAEMLEEAIRRQPNWPQPQIELGLMELQSGRDGRALDALRRVVKLDPFNKRAVNSLHMLEELADYARIETEHFIVRYKPGIDDVMVAEMGETLEEIHRTVTARFQFAPDRKTIIELMPNHQWFAVRIAGMPFIHTIAACTGPVIAMEVPREGAPGVHTGLYDWPRVVQHEYTHTVTLAQTRNRIPHWLTEAAAVEMERKPRPYHTCQLLARSLEQGRLFSLDEIKWAFVRPARPEDRSLAYAQGHWMLEYMNERFGDSAVLRLFERYFDGEREERAIPAVLGVSREEFFRDFLQWARRQVQDWGLAPSPSMRELTDELRWADPEIASLMRQAEQLRLDAISEALADRIGRASTGRERRELTAADWPEVPRPPVEISDEQLAAWLEQYPDHPDLVELQLRRMLRQSTGDDAAVPLLERYASLRPVDPFPHQRVAQIHLAGEERTKAIPHLEFLDAREEHSPVYAVQLAHLHREQGDARRALHSAQRALHINPYHAATRELAAAIAIEADRLDLARRHIEALLLLEPDRPQHRRRLEALERLMAARP